MQATEMKFLMGVMGWKRNEISENIKSWASEKTVRMQVVVVWSLTGNVGQVEKVGKARQIWKCTTVRPRKTWNSEMQTILKERESYWNSAREMN